MTRGAASLKDSAVDAIERRRLDVARPLWSRLCEVDPLDPDHWIVLSAIDERLGFLSAALDHLQYARRVSPEDRDVDLRSAAIRWRLRDLDGALEDMARALARDFTDREARLQYAEWLMECHRFHEALIHYRFLELTGTPLERRDEARAIACAWAAEDRQYLEAVGDRARQNSGEEPVFREAARQLAELLPESPLDRFDSIRHSTQSGSEAARRVRAWLRQEQSDIDWRAYFNRRAHVADHLERDRASLPEKAVASDIDNRMRAPAERLPHVLDLGCGTGRLADALASLDFEGIVTGIDYSPQSISVANAKNRYDNLIEQDLDEAIPGRLVAEANCVIISEVLHYCRAPGRLLHDVLSCLRPDAVVYVVWRSKAFDGERIARLATRAQLRHELHAWDHPGAPGWSVRCLSRCQSPAATRLDPSRRGYREEWAAERLIRSVQQIRNHQYDACRDSCQEILRTFPHSSQALFHLGVHAQQEMDFDRAARLFRGALLTHVGYASAWFQLGAVHQQRGATNKLPIHCYRTALRYQPDHFTSLHNLAHIFLSAGQADAAWEALRALLSSHALNVQEYLENLETGLDARKEGALSDRIAEYLRGADWIRARLHQALEHKRLRQADEFIDQLSEAGAAEPELRFHRARLEEKGGEPGAAVRRGLALLRDNRNDPGYWQFLAGASAARGKLKSSFRLWRIAAAAAEPSHPVHHNALFFSNYDATAEGETVARLHRQWGKRLSPSPYNAAGRAGSGCGAERLRIGYVSADFRMHSVAIFFYNILKYRDRRRFEVYCYSSTPAEDYMTMKLRLFSDYWREIQHVPNDEVARRIERDGVDILVDLNGHTAGNRLPLFSCKPAPIQCTYLGYPNTTGLNEMDYRITDEETDPTGTTEHLHSEELVRLPNGFLTYSRHLASTPVTMYREPHPTRHYTFTCCNNIFKINDRVIETWSQILKRLPDARLLVKAHNLDNREILDRYASKFSRHGVGRGQIHLMNTLDADEHQNLYNHTEIALDPFPYNGTTTTCDALWMGVPVLTLAGDRHAGRVGTSILTRIGLTDWIAADEQDYIDKAVRFACDKAYLRSLRHDMRKKLRNSPLMRPAVVTRDLESAFLGMWQRHEGAACGLD